MLLPLLVQFLSHANLPITAIAHFVCLSPPHHHSYCHLSRPSSYHCVRAHPRVDPRPPCVQAEYVEGNNIIVEGDEGNNFYIIRDGEVKATKTGKGEVSKRLVRGDFFGELALLSSDKRQATITATKPTKVLALARAEFSRLLGPLSSQITSESAAKRS